MIDKNKTMRIRKLVSQTVTIELGIGALGTMNATALPSVGSSSGMDSSRVLYLGVCLALLSSVSQIGKGLQKLGVDTLPELTLTPRTVKKYLGTRIWLLGVGLDIFGALIGLAALSMLPVSVAQPIFANGLVLLALFSYFYLKAPP
jgi:hypothetical protein